MKRFECKLPLAMLSLFVSATFACSSCITAKEAPKSYGERTRTSKEVGKSMKKSRKQSVKKMKNAGKYNPKTDF